MINIDKKPDEEMEQAGDEHKNHEESDEGEEINGESFLIDETKNHSGRRKCFQKIGGFDLISHRPMIDSKNEQLFAISGNSIRQYSTESGSFQRDFTFENRSNIISLTINPNNAREYIVVDEDGLLVMWNYVDNLKTNEVYLPLGGKKITYFQQTFDDYYFVIPTRNKNAGQIFYSNKMCLNQQYMALCRNDFVNFNAHQAVCFGPTEMPRYCAAIYENQLMIYEIPVKIKSQYRKHIYDVKYGKTFTCIAFHPIENCVATGDSKGMIVLWNGLMQPTPTRGIFHWHAQAVGDLAFSLSGTHLFSGGAEMVLVKWNLIGQNYGKSDFLPRLGMPIKLITVDPEQELIITSLEDQTLNVIDGQMNSPDKIIEGLTNGIDDHGALASGLHYSCRNKALALNGRVGHVQFYSPSQQKLISQLDITNQNIVSAVSTKTDWMIAKEKMKAAKQNGEKIESHCDKICPISVTKLAISDDGEWMATVEYRNDGRAFIENRLKFWHFQATKFGLITNVQLPHLDEITFVAFSPTVPALSKTEENPELHFVTCSKDGTFQVWDLTNDKKRPLGWSSEKVGSLDNVSVPRMATFSHDSTLLSVVFGDTITLWKNSARSLQLIPRDRIPQINRADGSQVKFIHFGVGFKTYFLLIGTDREIRILDSLKNFQTIYTLVAGPKETFERFNFDGRNNLLAIITGKSLKFLKLNEKHLTTTIPLNSGTNFSGKIVGSCFGNELLDFNLKVFDNLEYYIVNDRNEVYHVVQLPSGDRLEKYQSTILVTSEETDETNVYYKQLKSLKFESELSKVIASGQDTGKEEFHKNRRKNRQINAEIKKWTSNGPFQQYSFDQARCKLVEKFFDSLPTHVMPEPNVFDEPYLEALNLILDDSAKA